MKVTIYLCKKLGRVPNYLSISAELEQELELFCNRGGYNRLVVHSPSSYQTVRFGKNLESGTEAIIADRIIDKACAKDTYNADGNNSLKEILYYFQEESIDINHTFGPLMMQERSWMITDRKEIPENVYPKAWVRLMDKEKEMNTKSRFYGVASLSVKLLVSAAMEKVKKVASMLPNQMMK